jgi:hypothetical protein
MIGARFSELPESNGLRRIAWRDGQRDTAGEQRDDVGLRQWRKSIRQEKSGSAMEIVRPPPLGKRPNS